MKAHKEEPSAGQPACLTDPAAIEELRQVIRFELPQNLRQDDEDIAQRTLQECLGDKKFASLPPSAPKPYMLEAGRNNARDHVKAKFRGKRDARREQPLPNAGDCPEHGPTPGSAAAETERAAIVREALSQLPEAYRDVIELRDFQKLPFNEIASKQGKTEGAVRTFHTRAMQVFGQQLRKDHGSTSLRPR